MSLPAAAPAAPEDRPPARPGRLRATWSILWRALAFLVLFGGLVAAWLIPTLPMLVALQAEHRLPVRLLEESGIALSLLVATVVFVRVDRRSLAWAGLPARGMARHFALGLPTGAAWLGVVLAAAAALGWLVPVSAAPRPGALLGGVLVAALNVLTQQQLLSGYLYAMLRERAGVAVAVLVSAALFSTEHLAGYLAAGPLPAGGWLPPLNVFLAGLVFLAARERSGALWLGSGIHLGWNGLLGPVLGLSVSGGYALGWSGPLLRLGGPALWTGGGFGIEGGLVVTLVTLGLLAVLLAWRPASRAPAGPPPGPSGRNVGSPAPLAGAVVGAPGPAPAR